MYRKYQSSTKSSRHERLAQLSEQESVIEKKKREILAKLEAQKRKETEAFRKLEPSNVAFIVGENDNTQNFKKHSDTWEKDFEEGEPKVACHKNAFSNDGSFLDHFKKISSSLSQKSVDLLTLQEVTQSKEVFDCNKTLEKDCKKNKGIGICDPYKRNIYDVDIDAEKSDKKIPNSNIQNQLISSMPGWVQLIHSHHQVPLPHCSKLNDEVLKSTTTVAQSKAVPSQIMVKTHNANIYTNETRDVSLSPSRIPIMPVEKNIPSRKLHSLPEGSSFQVQTITTESTTQAGLRRDQYTDKDVLPINIAHNTFIDGAKKRRKSKYGEPWTQDYNDQMSRCSATSDKISRISPALTDDEEENRNEEHLRDAEGQEGRRTHSSLRSSNSCRSSSDEGEQEGLNSQGKRTTEDIDLEEEVNRKEGKEKGLECDSTDTGSHSKDSYHSTVKPLPDNKGGTNVATSDGYKTDCDDESIYAKTCYQTNKKFLIQESLKKAMLSSCNQDKENPGGCGNLVGKDSFLGERRKPKKKSRWGDEVIQGNSANTTGTSNIITVCSGTGGKTPMLSRLTRSDPGLLQYARQTFGSTNLSEDDWKKAEDHYKINLLYQDMVKKRAEIDRLEKAGKFKYEYDSDEDVEGGTWEHKLRQQEMMATQLWAEELTRQAAGKHHIGDFLPPEELERFMEKYNAVKQGRNPDLSDYKEFKLKEDNVGYRLLQKMGWNEGEGLGQSGTGIKNPVNKASTRHENQGLGVDRPDGLQAGDDEYDAYRKRMMLAYRFRPNPLNNPRRPYY